MATVVRVQEKWPATVRLAAVTVVCTHRFAEVPHMSVERDAARPSVVFRVPTVPCWRVWF